MCGIATFWGPERRTVDARVRGMTTVLTHRGPDDEGIEMIPAPFGFVGLGQRRLAIQDLSPAGHQPMTDPATGNWINYNGEIYNYPALRAELSAAGVVFRSRCDTEAILHAYAQWGIDAFARLHGMFALVLFDTAAGRLVLARDHIGMKPLYYAWGPTGFAAGSEVRAVMRSGVVAPEIDRAALAGLLAYGAVQAPLTMYRGVTLLDAGTVAEIPLTRAGFEARAHRSTTYWTIPLPEGLLPSAAPSPEREVRRLLGDAVRSHLLSDVPVGVFLSSGIDSSAIALLCAEADAGPINTFTVGLADEGGDEGPVAARTAATIGARHHEIRLTDAEAQCLTLGWLDALDQPSVDGLNTYIISHAVRERGIKVALSGLGGDEVFAGYPSFRDVPRLARLSRATNWIPRPVRQSVTAVLFRSRNRLRRWKAVDMAGLDGTFADVYFRRRRLLSDCELTGLGLGPDAADTLGLDACYQPPGSALPTFDATDPVAAVSTLESRYYMGNMLLRDADVFGMAHGLEIRVPFLDKPLIDYAYRLPGPVRLPPAAPGKSLVREALADVLPSEVRRLRKRGFALPFVDWMRGPLREPFEAAIATVRQSGLVDPDGVSAVWNDFHSSPDRTTWSHPWALGVLGSWLTRWPGRTATAAG